MHCENTYTVQKANVIDISTIGAAAGGRPSATVKLKLMIM